MDSSQARGSLTHTLFWHLLTVVTCYNRRPSYKVEPDVSRTVEESPNRRQSDAPLPKRSTVEMDVAVCIWIWDHAPSSGGPLSSVLVISLGTGTTQNAN
ncbi:hypothetical protein BJV78DRAFT_1214791 [Lactifluus subvellereus]|nr:hypothetical protein BJV78DRAFT_1214791 [Lactifluus subvellereus]